MSVLMERYARACAEFPKAIVLMRAGDFFEAFGEPAKMLAEALGLTLTERDGMPAAAIPHHVADRRIAQLVAAGQQVILMDQPEEPCGERRLT